MSRVMPGEEAVQEVLRCLGDLVGCDFLFWNRTDVDQPRLISEIGFPRPPVKYSRYADWARHRHEHPIMSGVYGGPVVAISDVYAEGQFERTWMYEAVFRSHVEHEIGVHLSHPPGQLHVVCLSRSSGRDFDERDHLVLRLLQPHLDAAFRRMAFPPPRLTPREVEVLRLVRDGMSNTQIAHRLSISDATVAKHLENVYARTGAQTRVQVVNLCASALE